MDLFMSLRELMIMPTSLIYQVIIMLVLHLMLLIFLILMYVMKIRGRVLLKRGRMMGTKMQ
ncbi:hypothetical protein PTKIN_Ptkin16aG0067500 [Pterospermum kingtungense]